METLRRNGKLELEKYLNTLVVNILRPLSRYFGIQPKLKDKEELISNIVSVVIGELQPPPKSKAGKPSGNDYVPAEVLQKITEIYQAYFIDAPTETGGVKELFPDLFVNGENSKTGISFSSADGEKILKNIYCGQYHKIDGVARVLPLDCSEETEAVLLSDLLVESYNLHEGDVLSYRATKGTNSLIVKQVLMVNDNLDLPLKRELFEKYEADIPNAPITFISEKQAPTPLLKYFDWILNIQKGQRCCVVSSPKVGKTSLLYTALNALARQDGGLTIMALLIDQPPETVSLYRSAINGENLIYTTYEDEVEKQAFTAEFILNRAKRYAESGNDVVLFVDGLNALAHAYNQTENAVGGKTLDGGLESKTKNYLKKFFGSAKRLKNGGSLTIIGALSQNTGNPADDLLARELTAISNAEIYLDEKLALKRIFPPIDVVKSRVDLGGTQSQENTQELLFYLKTEYLHLYGNEGLYSLLVKAENKQEFMRFVYSQTAKKP